MRAWVTHYEDKPNQSNLYPVALGVERRTREAAWQHSIACDYAIGVSDDDRCDVCDHLGRLAVLARRVTDMALRVDALSFRRDWQVPAFVPGAEYVTADERGHDAARRWRGGHRASWKAVR